MRPLRRAIAALAAVALILVAYALLTQPWSPFVTVLPSPPQRAPPFAVPLGPVSPGLPLVYVAINVYCPHCQYMILNTTALQQLELVANVYLFPYNLSSSYNDLAAQALTMYLVLRNGAAGLRDAALLGQYGFNYTVFWLFANRTAGNITPALLTELIKDEVMDYEDVRGYVTATPTFLVYSPTGRPVAMVVGYNEAELEAALRAAAH